MEFYDFPFSWECSQLTNSIIFQSGRYTTNQVIVIVILEHIEYEMNMIDGNLKQFKPNLTKKMEDL
jgi:hypothetical protein